MNLETGELFRGAAAIEAARAEGQPIVAVSERVAKLVAAGHRAEERAKAKRKRKQARKDRKRNRR